MWCTYKVWSFAQSIWLPWEAHNLFPFQTTLSKCSTFIWRKNCKLSSQGQRRHTAKVSMPLALYSCKAFIPSPQVTSPLGNLKGLQLSGLILSSSLDEWSHLYYLTPLEEVGSPVLSPEANHTEHFPAWQTVLGDTVDSFSSHLYCCLLDSPGLTGMERTWSDGASTSGAGGIRDSSRESIKCIM